MELKSAGVAMRYSTEELLGALSDAVAELEMV
jgi:hypothetical protein